MRTLRLGALLAAAALTATACGGGDPGGDGPVTLRFSWWGSDARHTMTQQLIEAFHAEHPDIRVEGEFTGWADYWDKLATSTAGGNAPDVMQQESRYVREYADRNALLDLGRYDVDVSKLDPAVAGTGKVGDATYAIPTGVNAYTVVVDTALYEQAGVPIPDDETWSWDDFVDTTAAITANTGGKVHGVQNIGFNEAGLEIFARQRGESIFTADGAIGLSDQTLSDWFALILRLRDRKSEPEPSVTIETQAGGIDQSLMATNRGATGVWWTNELATLTKASGHELALLRFPGESQGRPGMYFKPAMFFAASSRSEHPEAAATFIDWLVNSPKAAEIQLSDRGLPANTEVREQVFGKLKAADQQSGEFLREIGPTLAPPPVLPPPGAGEVQGVLQQLNEQLLFDRISVPEAVSQFRQQAEAALK
ncbi:ABC transporter substrate-binding protein [Actinokineospora sp. UTMC 2448]|uniref:ABC transporter substrate-binding protein n=1 Tax=Actinokineospora sp. UTMC 2448 TaxID=2268449 RepID=UPI0021649C46|nr:extracellular solute-binding protein [Actinokineospora sp. UTMC 2448]UVS78928.1 Putative ABC transporter substrate-binding protein YesO [Actinokineospora sp. UTMC 2448]